jgi:poly(3-hydroxybutyrate) depolymerase
MRSILALLFLVFLVLANTKEAELTTPSGEKSGILPFAAGPDFQNKVIPVHYYVPAGDPAAMSVQIVLHGASRNADEYLDAWKIKADKYGIIILAPEFSKKQFTIGAYTHGLFVDSLNRMNPPQQTLFALMDRMFAFAKAEFQWKHERYNIYGHSAGGQFVHRFLQFYHSPHIDKAVAANPGWYTYPDEGLEYPYGIGGLFEDHLAHRQTYYAKDMLILLGTADTSRVDNLRVNLEADLQGLTRLERGKNFYAANMKVAESAAQAFNWKIAFVPDSGHQHELMSAAAAEIIYGKAK